MSIPLFHVDAFTDRAFAGNPAAVCLLEQEAPADWMQAVAAELNLSETAFLLPRADGYGLRWFTPKVEVDLCGHATLASAHILWETGRLDPSSAARFFTRSGWLSARQAKDWIELDFPATPPELIEPPADLDAALGASPRWVGRSRFDLFVELASAEEVRTLKPNFALLGQLPDRGVIVTAISNLAGRNFVSRFFAPRAGIDEDPVTGSAHCALGPFWASRLGRDELVGYQMSPRGGVVKVRLAGARVWLGGQAVTVLRGEWVG